MDDWRPPNLSKADETKKTSLCICGGCPSYKGTGETALMFCVTRKSRKIAKEKGCVCDRCPVTKQMSLKHDYYCTLGSEKEQSAPKK
jgi:hypothetical protein